MRLLGILEETRDLKFDLRFGGEIGVVAKNQNGKPLPDNIITFCRDIFSQGGAILNGPGGDRYVYDLRVQFDLFCKFRPLKVSPQLHNAGRMKPESVRDVDILLVRENVSGFIKGNGAKVPPNTRVSKPNNRDFIRKSRFAALFKSRRIWRRRVADIYRLS